MAEKVMAEEVIKKVEDRLNCLICLDTYRDPKQLQCNHVFCSVCLQQLAAVENQQGLPCPTCRQITPIPPVGVPGLQPAFQASQLVEILNEHKKDMQGILYCPQHHKRELELYCDNCGELVCINCITEEHHDHKYNLIGDVFEKHKLEIESSLHPVKEHLTLANKALEVLDIRCGEIEEQQATLLTQIRKNSKQLREVIDLRETELINDLNFITDSKLTKLVYQREQVKAIQAQRSRFLDTMQEKLRMDRQGVVLKEKADLIAKGKRFTDEFRPDILKPDTCTEADMLLTYSQSSAEACRVHGLVSTVTVLQPPQCCAASAVGKHSSTLVTTHEEKSLEELVKYLQCKLVSELADTQSRCSIKSRGEGQYDVCYQPTIKGKHHLHIEVLGQHIRGSPFSVAVKSVENLGTPILIIDELKHPWGVAINHQSGEVVVAEAGGHCVSVLSSSGKKLHSFGTEGTDQGQFKSPRGVAVDGNGNILVADYGNHRIQKFTMDGQFIAAVGIRGSGPLQFNLLKGIAINKHNHKVYVIDKNRVQVLNSDLTFSNSLEGVFNSLSSITCDSSGNICVAGDRIQVFTPTGNLLRSYFNLRSQTKQIFAIGSDVDNVYVISNYKTTFYEVIPEYNYYVHVFTTGGQHVSSSKIETFNCTPRGIVIDNNGVVYVCESNNDLLKVL